jgi:hypothetical protein
LDYEADALLYDGWGGYVMETDTWLCDPFIGSFEAPVETVDPDSYTIHTRTGKGHGGVDLVRIVSNGDVSWDGTFSRNGLDYPVVGSTAE